MELDKMNILFFTRSMNFGGTENVILQLCEVLKPYVNNIIVCSSGGVNVKHLDKMQIEHYDIPDISIKSLGNFIKTIAIILKIINNNNINVIHSHHRMAAFYTQIVSKKNVIKVANVHNTFYDKKIFTKMAYKNTNLIAVGNQVRINLKNIFEIPEEEIHVIYNSIKPFNGEIIPSKELQEAREKGFTIIGNIGRLSEQKGMEYFIDAVELVCQVNNKVMFFIIGDGEDRCKLEARSSDKNLKEKLHFLGYREDVQNLMCQMDFIVLSSLWEGFPLTPIETFSVRKTIIATSVDGTVEIVENEKNGVLIEARNVKVLAEKIQRMIQNSEEKKEMELYALKTYKEKFSFDIFGRRYLEFYKELVES